MYAERSRGFRLRPASLGAALAINGGIIAALLTANPDVIERIVPRSPIRSIFEPAPEPTPPPPERPRPRDERPSPQPTADPLPERPLDPSPLPPWTTDTGIKTGTGGDIVTGTGTGGGGDVIVPPVFVAAAFDPRYAGDLQPPYPDTLRDAGIEGAVKLRVLIAPDGRVARIEALEGNSALVKVATRHALARWRFRPATRGGVPEESWKVMVVRFRIE